MPISAAIPETWRRLRPGSRAPVRRRLETSPSTDPVARTATGKSEQARAAKCHLSRCSRASATCSTCCRVMSWNWQRQSPALRSPRTRHRTGSHLPGGIRGPFAPELPRRVKAGPRLATDARQFRFLARFELRPGRASPPRTMPPSSREVAERMVPPFCSISDASLSHIVGQSFEIHPAWSRRAPSIRIRSGHYAESAHVPISSASGARLRSLHSASGRALSRPVSAWTARVRPGPESSANRRSLLRLFPGKESHQAGTLYPTSGLRLPETVCSFSPTRKKSCSVA